MLRRWSSRLAGLAVLVAALGAAAPARAQVAVFTLKSVDDLMSEVKYVLTLAGQEEQAQQAEALLNSLTGGKGLAGIDTKKPLGVYAHMPKSEGQEPRAAIFLPIAKQDDFLDLLKQVNVDVTKGEGGIYTFEANGQKGYFRFANGYAYASDKEDAIKGDLPDPAKFVPAVNRANLVAATLRIDQIPANLKQTFIAEMDKKLEEEKGKKEGESDQDYQVRLAVTKAMRQAVVAAVEDGKELTLSFDISQKNSNLALDLALTAKPGSKLATKIQEFGPATTVAPVHIEIAVAKLVQLFMPEDADGKIGEAYKKVFAGADKEKDKVRLTFQGGEALRLRLDVSALMIKLGAMLAPKGS